MTRVKEEQTEVRFHPALDSCRRSNCGNHTNFCKTQGKAPAKGAPSRSYGQNKALLILMGKAEIKYVDENEAFS